MPMTQPMRRVLGIDPGTTLIGYGLIEAGNGQYHAIEYGPLRTPPKVENQYRVAAIYDFVHALIERLQPDLVALEKLFFFKNAKTVMAVSEIRGVIILAAVRAGVEICEYTPLQVKQAVTGYGRAGKNQIQAMIKLILNLSELPKPDDVADALAIAICAANSQ